MASLRRKLSLTVPEGEPPEGERVPLETPTAREVEARLDAEISGRGPAKRARVVPSLGLDVQMADAGEAPADPERLETPCAATVDSIFGAALAETSTAAAGADGGGGGTMCVLKLPAQWDQERFKKLLSEQHIVYQSVKKKAGKWTYGFVTFCFLDQRVDAETKLRDLMVQGVPLSVADAVAKERDDRPAAREKAVRVCFAFQKGECTRGDQCKFEHVAASSGTAAEQAAAGAGAGAGVETGKKGSRACFAFQKGQCKYGDKCKFAHVDARNGGVTPEGGGEAKTPSGLVPEAIAASAPKDIRDAVTPLWRLPYAEQLQRKRATVLAALGTLAKKGRKEAFAASRGEKTVLPPWLWNARKNGNIACPLEGIVRSPVLNGYRNKCEFSVGLNRHGLATVGFLLGSFKEGYTAIGEPHDCLNVSATMKTVASIVQAFVRDQSKLPAWDKRRNAGVWRLVIAREGSAAPLPGPWAEYVRLAGEPATASESADDADAAAEDGASPTVVEEELLCTSRPKELMVCLQINAEGTPPDQLNAECRALEAALQAGCAAAEPPIPLTVCLAQLHAGCANAAMPDAPVMLLTECPHADGGEGSKAESGVTLEIRERMCGLEFQLSVGAFFQVNTAAATMLYQLAGDWAACGGRTLLFDVCCGTGTIGLTLASRVRKLVGVDIVETAIKDAAANAARLGVTNAEFVCGKAEVVLPGLLRAYDAKVGGTGAADKGEHGEKEERFENIVAIVDPPRAGLHKNVLSALRAAKGLRRLVYVSCNPESLAENAVVLCAPADRGNPHAPRPFHPVKAMAVDLFPHTKHCEAVMLFERADPQEETGGKETGLGYVPQE